MLEQLKEIEAKALAAIGETISAEQLIEIKIAYLGKKGELTALSRQMGQVAPAERPILGAAVNQVKNTVEAAVMDRMAEFRAVETAAALLAETIDITLPGAPLASIWKASACSSWK